VQGAVRLKSFCAEPAAIAGYGPLVAEDGRSFAATLLKPVAGGFAARLSGVSTREQAEALKGTRLYAPRERLPALGDDEFYRADLIGLTVLDTGGAVLGRVRTVNDHGAGDILEVATPGGGEMLLPFTWAVVPTVDLAAGRIIADPPDDLADDG
jgi:16S rRNA processing protein RimM